MVIDQDWCIQPVELWDGFVWKQPDWFSAIVEDLRGLAPSPVAFPQLEIRNNPEYAALVPNGTLLIEIKNFNPKGLQRHIRYRPHGTSQNLPVSEISGPSGQKKTRWDSSLGNHFNPNGRKQRIIVQMQISNDNQLKFYWPSKIYPITVKDQDSQMLFANPRFGPSSDTVVEFDLLYHPTDQGMQGIANYNIALVVNESGNSPFWLPILVDPRMENRG